MAPRYLSCFHVFFLNIADIHFLGFGGQYDPQAKDLPFRSVCLKLGTSGSSGPRNIAFYVFMNGVGGHFENHCITELVYIFKNKAGSVQPYTTLTNIMDTDS